MIRIHHKSNRSFPIGTMAGILFFLFFSLPLFAGEGGDGGTKKEPGPWNIEYSYGEGKTEVAVDQGKLGLIQFFTGSLYPTMDPVTLAYFHNQLSGEIPVENREVRVLNEYLPGHVGIRFGMSTTQSTPDQSKNLDGVVGLLAYRYLSEVLLDPARSPFPTLGETTDQYTILTYYQFVREQLKDPLDRIGTVIPMAEASLSIHFTPGQLLDPYLNLGAGIGAHSRDAILYKAFARMGLRLNLPRHYFFLEGEMSHKRFLFKTGTIYGLQLNLREKTLYFGTGFRV